MGYAFYELCDGREAGYGVEATCDEDGCDESIDRGLAYLCGDDPHINGDEPGCGQYFCSAHLYYVAGEDRAVQRCDRCSEEPCPKCGDTGFVVYDANPDGERRMADADCPRGCPDYRTREQPLEDTP